MKKIRHVSAAVILLVLVQGILSGPAFGQESDAGKVQGTGSITIQRVPETMRVQVAIIGKGASLKDALASLKTRVESARTQVIALGADKATIKVDSAKIHEQQNDGQRRMEMMMAQRMKAAGKKSKKEKAAPPIMVAATLTASWSLKAKDDEDLLLSVHPLQQKIKAADLAGAKDAEKLSAEQEELLEEMGNNGYDQYGNNEAKPGEPVFMFVSRISDEDREKALAEAYQKDKSEAARLVKSANAGLGGLKSIQESLGGADMDDYNSARYNQRAYQLLQMARSRSNPHSENIEAIGVEPGMIKYVVSVIASFDIGPKQ